MPKSVAIFDEDVDLLVRLKAVLERVYNVFIATSVYEVLRLVETQPIDVLLAEFRAQGSDGMELLRTLSERSYPTRVVLMTTGASAEDYKRALELGAVELLTKPFTAEALAKAIRAAVDSDRGFRGRLHGIALLDVVQLFHLGRRSASIHLRPGSAIHMENGEVIHVEHGTQVGKGALAALLAVDSGSVRSTPLETSKRTIFEPFNGLLLDALCVVDEMRAGTRSADIALVEPTFAADPAEDTGAYHPPIARAQTEEQIAPFQAMADDSIQRRSGRSRVARWSLVAALLLLVSATVWVGYAIRSEPGIPERAPTDLGEVGHLPGGHTPASERRLEGQVNRRALPPEPALPMIRRLRIKTRPPGLALVRADTGEVLGTSPLEMNCRY